MATLYVISTKMQKCRIIIIRSVTRGRSVGRSDFFHFQVTICTVKNEVLHQHHVLYTQSYEYLM